MTTKIWNLRENAEDRHIGRRIRRLMVLMEKASAEADSLYEACKLSKSNRLADKMSDEGIDDPPTLGFSRTGVISFVARDLREHLALLEEIGSETVQDLLTKRRNGTGDLGPFVA